jgi:predicted helicase
MRETFTKYINEISKKYSVETTSEYGYRTDFENLLKDVFATIKVKRIDHDAKAQKGNKPDFVIVKGEIPILYIETKNIETDLDKVEKSEQMARYYGYANLILTDYVEFRFYRNGLKYQEPIKIAEYYKKDRTITPIPEHYEFLGKTLIEFTQSYKEPIKSGLHLTKIMGGKAQRIRDNMKEYLKDEGDKSAELVRVYEMVKKLLVNDLTHDSFADMYAQTLVYGLFAARYNDDNLETFSRQEARDLIPKSNPLLMHFFDHIAGPNFDSRLAYIVNELCEVFSHADVKKLMGEYFEKEDGKDPVIYFYEDFLKEYDPDLRKRMGAYYTPKPVVDFIVESVDHILKKDFKLPNGLSDSSKSEDGKHIVQVLDPAVGTGTFISAVIGNIYKNLLKTGQKGRWHKYVHNELLPRIHGFELMMAPYTIAHIKLGLAFEKTGFKHFNRRLGIYLTNSLEEGLTQEDLFSFGFAESIAEESKEALKIKKETPIMVVLGNPPYSVSSSNKGEWIQELIKVYKKDLNERNIQPLSDDYIKFIRFAEHFIGNNKTGIVAMITNNSFLGGIIHRQMRKHLLETFDDIYILDLHGNSKKKEVCLDGSKDENVFNIMQGVSINIFVKKKKENKELANVFHCDLYGKREKKFEFLEKNNLKKIKWVELKFKKPYYFFVPKDFKSEKSYNESFKIQKLFINFASGIATGQDSFVVKWELSEILELRQNLFSKSKEEMIKMYNLRENQIQRIFADKHNIINKYTEILYRPFDYRYTLYSPKSNGLIQRPRPEIMKHMVKDNLALLTCKKQTSYDFQHIFLSRNISDRCSVSLQTGEVGYIFPLYLYSENGTKTPNLNEEIVSEIEKTVGKVKPEEIFDYIYAVLHSPKYRKKYKEFLKIDFPRVPYPKNKKSFKKLVNIGTELRNLHLMESPKLNKYITTYPEDGSDTVEKISYKDGNVYINEKQYFGNVPAIAWNFYIGGYQPAQKWLKDRKGRTLNNDDIEHYQKIIVVLTETEKVMKGIDQIITF